MNMLEVGCLAFSSGPNTFFNTPYVSNLENLPEAAEIAILGVPFDEGVVNRPGTRLPRPATSTYLSNSPLVNSWDSRRVFD